ncbi:hypothetical protein [Candidatus Harpocratesius sp.]
MFQLPVNTEMRPNAADMSYVIKKIPAADVFYFFQQLVEECIQCGIISTRILIWDD